MSDPFQLPKHLWCAGVAAVSGRRCVAEAIDRDGPFAADLAVAVGKAACSMHLGAASCTSATTKSIIATKYGHVDAACRADPRTDVIEAGHPTPDQNSLDAGRSILDAVAGAAPHARLLLLVSGGASVLVEVLQPGFDLAQLQAVNRSLVGSGQSIARINEARSRMSLIKGGRLLGRFRGAQARVYALSDVHGDALTTIGSGIGDPRHASAEILARVVASNAEARAAVVREAERLGLQVRLDEETLYGDVNITANRISATLRGGNPGVYVWGGEPTIALPPNPGIGGRNQSLALAIATQIRGVGGISVVVAGTDGTDGPTDFAGACVDGTTVDDAGEAEVALQRANAGEFLGRRGSLFRSGVTGTNVMDLVVATVG
jgi:glycerate 2-kinase